MVKKVTVEVLVEGGKATAGASLGGSLGPLKVNIGQVVSKINDMTKDFKGMKVPVKVIVDPDTKEFEITIGTPPASQLVMKEIGLEKGSGEPNTLKAGVISFEQVIKVAKMKQSTLIVNNLKSAVKTILGSCQSAGIMVDGKDVIEIIKEVDAGKYDVLINSGNTEPGAEKKKELEIIAKDLAFKVKEREKQKAAAKAEAEAKAAAKAAEITAAPGTASAAAAPKAEATKPAVKK